jgi:hypothetical protein
MTALNGEEPDRVPLGEWHVDRMPMESYLGRKIVNLRDEIDFWIEMKNTISALNESGLRDSVKIVVRGAPVTQAFADEIDADGYGYESPGASQICKELLNLK